MFDKLDGARGVFVDPDTLLAGAWFGGTATNIFSTETGGEVDQINTMTPHESYDSARRHFMRYARKEG